MKIFITDQIWSVMKTYDFLWSKMTLSGIITTKTSKSPGKPKEVRGGLRSGNKVSQNTFKNTPEDDLDTKCDIISHLTQTFHPKKCWVLGMGMGLGIKIFWVLGMGWVYKPKPKPKTQKFLGVNI